MSKILTMPGEQGIVGGVPIPYRILIEGEVSGPGITDAHVHGLIQQGLSFNARLAGCNKVMAVQVGAAIGQNPQ